MEKTIINTVTDLDGEKWRTVDFNNKVRVSNFGRVSYEDHRQKDTIKIKLSKQSKTEFDYLIVNVYDSIKNKRVYKKVHRLVAICFINNPNNLLEVNHKDCNKENNHVNNLEWLSGADNLKHAKENQRQIKNYGLSTPIIQLDLDGNIIARYISINSAAIALGINRKYIRLAVIGRINAYMGYRWVVDTETEPTTSHKVCSNKAIKVQQFDLDGNFIKEHESVKAAARELNIDPKTIRNVLSGEQKTAGGFIWVKVEN